MKILIATGIYPPDIGGPAQYAANVERVWKSLGHSVNVKTFRYERLFPSGLRHVLYFLKCLPDALNSDFIFVLDTLSAALPAVLLGRIFRKRTVVRTGGDFLWESYVERTGDLVLFRDFYNTRTNRLSWKERLIFRLTRRVLRYASAVVFSTEWQKDIWMEPYGLKKVTASVVENYYGRKELSYTPTEKNFLAGTRPLKWKNAARLAEAFRRSREKGETIVFDESTRPFGAFMDTLAHAYGVILVSLGDISPNLILDAIRHDKPFIVTRETGLHDRIEKCALFVDPEDVDDISAKILWLSNTTHYEEQKKKVGAFAFTHTWEEIADEILAVYKKI